MIEHSAGGDVTVLKPSVKLQAGEVIDASRLSAAKLREYIEAELTQAKADGVMVSVHLKATMMKISDPIMFGHFVSVFKDAFAKHADAFAALGVNPNLGLGSLYEKLKALPDAEREAIEADLAKCYESRPKLAMVDSTRASPTSTSPGARFAAARRPRPPPPPPRPRPRPAHPAPPPPIPRRDHRRVDAERHP